MSAFSIKNQWLVYHQPNPQAKQRLFCLPYAGANSNIFRSWPAALPTVEICSVELPGHGGRSAEVPFSQFAPLIKVLVQHLRPHLDKPFAFFGHSLGALLSFELTRILTNEHEPFHLFVSGCRAPQLPLRSGRTTYDLPEAEFIEELRSLSGTPKIILDDVNLMRLLLPMLRADLALDQTYTYIPGRPLACPISVFAGVDDSEVTRGEIEAWQEQTSASFSLRFFPGDHFFIHTSQGTLMQELSKKLLVAR